MSNLDLITAALPRIDFACRSREVRNPKTGAHLTDHQIRTLRQLDVADPTMVTELAEFLGVTASTMSLNLKRLEEGGFIQRTRDPADRRVMNVLLTEAGLQMLELASPYDPERVAAMLAGLRPDERRRALEGLGILVEAADRLVARGRAYVDSLSESGTAETEGPT
ncbi:MAG: MarR family transcriptional regulator [Longimicrobiales bacterium]|nr:MarR family transcriptional regulator [Longimicrobiales bacterium]